MLESSNTQPGHLLRGRLHQLYVITEDGNDHGDLTHHDIVARAAITGGARLIQLRGKTLPQSRLFEAAKRIRIMTRRAGVLFIINDRPDLALACDADGVHLGPDDTPLAVARKVLGPHRLIGLSCGDEGEAREAWRLGADYIGAGAVFATQTKSDAGAPIGCDGLRRIVHATPLPVAAIGGINLQNLASTVNSGAAMACVVSAVTRAGNEAEMTAATRALASHWRPCA